MTSRGLLRSGFVLILAACVFWVARFARIFAPDFIEVGPATGWMIAFFGYFASIFALNRVAKLGFSGQGRSASSDILRRFCPILAFSGLVFLPFVPDVFAAFREGMSGRSSSSGVAMAIGLTGFAWICVTTVGALYRLPLIWMCDRKSIRFGYVALLPFVEITQLVFFPFAYVGSMALPVFFPPLQKSFQGNPLSQGGQSGLLSVAYAASWSDETRSSLRREPEDGRIFEIMKTDLGSVEVNQSESILRVYFPETLFDVSSSRIVTFYESAEELLKMRSPWLKQIEFFAGVGSSDSNSVVWIGRNELTGMVQIRSATRKAIPVPFFETPIFGFRFWESVNASSPSQSDWDDVLPLRDRDRAMPSIALPQFLICYEGLFPQLREYGSDAVIFTNHNLFSRYALLSRSYDEMLVLISSAARQRVLLVGNSGRTGFVQPWRDVADSGAFGRIEVLPGSDPRTHVTD